MGGLALLADLAKGIAALPDDAPRLVGVDGVDGVGKTFFADELSAVLRAAGVTALRVSIDGFHRPRAERYRRGRYSPEGYYRDSSDYPAFRAAVVAPLRSGGGGVVRTAAFDAPSDRPVEGDVVAVAAGQRLYLARCRPERRASVVVDNADLDAPRVVGGTAVDRAL